MLGDVIYIAAGSGHVYGLSKKDLHIVWDFYIGSDMDGSTVVTGDGKLLVPVEKQYISGHGGMYLARSRPSPPARPSSGTTRPRTGASPSGPAAWSAPRASTTRANQDGRLPRLVAFNSVDGFLYVVSRDELSGKTTEGPNGEKNLPKPKLVFRSAIGGGISTPIIVDDYLITTGYDQKVHLYRIDYLTTAPPGRRARG